MLSLYLSDQEKYEWLGSAESITVVWEFLWTITEHKRDKVCRGFLFLYLIGYSLKYLIPTRNKSEVSKKWDLYRRLGLAVTLQRT